MDSYNENLENNNIEENSLLYEYERKKDYNKVSKSAFLFLLYTLIFGIVFSFINDAGILNLLVISFSLISIYFYIGKGKKEAMIVTHKKMSFLDLIFFLGLMYGLNLIFSYIAIFLVDIVGVPSIDVTEEISLSANILLLVYASFLGPIFEEIQYRGFYLNHVRKYGIQTAIILSTILFCFAHMNIIQSIGTLGIGLVLSYVAYVYSFKMAVLVHIINNIIALVSTYQTSIVENSKIEMFVGLLILSLIVFAIIRLIFGKKYKEIFENLKYKGKEKENFNALLKNGWFIAYFIVALLLSIASGFYTFYL
nr:type II CAAX endopeptidase family protein [Helcococcus sueciensis]